MAMEKTENPKRYLASAKLRDVDTELAKSLEKAYQKVLPITDPVKRAQCFYEIQSCCEIGTVDDTCKIGVFVDNSVSIKYHKLITNTLSDINIAAPGLYLHESNTHIAKIKIIESGRNGCYTQGIFKGKNGAEIHLSTNWNDDWIGKTIVHELLHALGFQHEFKRKDAGGYVIIRTDNSQYKDPEDHEKIRGLTRFDPFSVMMYPENEDMERNENGDTVWKLKSDTNPNKHMSELDKVALNMVFRPCRGDDYNPEKERLTGMFYCKRRVMDSNQQNCPTDTDGRCGPNNWANCPACRVLKGGKVMHNKWQGWSGVFYCGKQIGSPKTYYKKGKYLKHDGFCGPNNGPPCNECGKALYSEYDYFKEVEGEDTSSCVII